MEQQRFIVTFLAISIITLSLAIADEPAQSTTGPTGQFTPPGSSQVGAGGGNVTEVNISADVSTSKWQGYWGNVSGSLRLGDGSNIFYDWSDVTFQAVFAAPTATPDWENIAGISSTIAKQGKDTAFGFTNTEPDSITNTMTSNTCEAGTHLAAAAGVTPYDNNGDPGSWETCIGDDGTETLLGTVFGTNIITSGATAFNGLTVQFQLMVPAEDGGTDYYFFLEI